MKRPFAVISGGSSGIGLALARRLAARGYDLALIARGEDRLRSAAAALGGTIEVHVVDVGDPAAIDRVATAILARHPTIDLLVCNAGIPGRSGVLDVDPARARAVMDVNYHGMVGLTRALWPALMVSGGRVVNVCSVAGTVAIGASAPYTASKHAALAWSRALAGAAGRSGVRVLTVNPGPVATEGFPQTRLLERRQARRLVISADRCADAIVTALDRRRTEIFVPGWWRIVGVLQAIAPATVARLGARMNAR